jgi:hypothetical protein
MKSVALIAAILVVTFSVRQEATAGIHVGNGGDAVVCSDGAQLLDYYEATTILRDLSPDLGPNSGPGDSYHPMIDHVIARVRRHNAGLATRLKQYTDDFVSNAEFVDNGVLTDINDSHHVVLPAGCEVKQIAIQREPRFPEEPRYLVDEGIFHQLDLPNRAMLAMHEALYRITLEHGQVNSLNVRYLNAYLSSSKPDRDSTQEFNDVLMRTGIGVEFWFDEVTGRYWALFEKGIETPFICSQLAGDFYAPSVRELTSYALGVLLSPLERFLFANGQDRVTIWSGDWDTHRDDCPGRGTNAYKTVTISDREISVGYQCMRSSGPILLCLEK